jgi:hypothetical protein
MKKLIATLIIASLLIPQLATAKNSDLVKVEYVQTQSVEKGIPFFVAFIRIGFRVYRVLSRANNVNRLVEQVKVHVDRYGFNNSTLTQSFGNELKISLIESFYATSSNYKTFEKIMFKAKLKEKAYTYLVSVSNDGACLLFPNSSDKKNLYQANKYYTFANKDYKIYANAKGVEKFSFVSSTKPLLSKLKSTFNISTSVYSCGSRSKGNKKLKELRGMSGVDVRGVDIIIK